MTFLTTPAHKAELDAYAAAHGQSVRHVVREATSRYIAQPREESAEEAELVALVAQVNEAVPEMRASIETMIESMRKTHEQVDRTLRAAGIRT